MYFRIDGPSAIALASFHGRKRVAQRVHVGVGADAGIAEQVPGAADRLAAFEDGVALARAAVLQVPGGADARQAGADDQHVRGCRCCHFITSGPNHDPHGDGARPPGLVYHGDACHARAFGYPAGIIDRAAVDQPAQLPAAARGVSGTGSLQHDVDPRVGRRIGDSRSRRIARAQWKSLAAVRGMTLSGGRSRLGRRRSASLAGGGGARCPRRAAGRSVEHDRRRGGAAEMARARRSVGRPTHTATRLAWRCSRPPRRRGSRSDVPVLKASAGRAGRRQPKPSGSGAWARMSPTYQAAAGPISRRPGVGRVAPDSAAARRARH